MPLKVKRRLGAVPKAYELRSPQQIRNPLVDFLKRAGIKLLMKYSIAFLLVLFYLFSSALRCILINRLVSKK